jgi:hypothetical protein
MEETPRHHGLLLLPYLGLNFPTGDGSTGMSTGFRLGGLLGFYAGPFLSFNGELTIDFLNVDSQGGPAVSDVMLDWAFSPLFHISVPHMDFVVGPKLGLFTESSSYDYNGTTYSADSYGYVYGFNAGAFFAVGRMSVGGLLNFTGHSYSHSCDYNGNCVSASGGSDFKVIGFSGALLF